MDFNEYAKFTDKTAIYEDSIKERYTNRIREAVGMLSDMEVSEHQEDVTEAALYEIVSAIGLIERDLALFYKVMGFIGEAGEVANKVKKFLRDGASIETTKKELGGAAYYFARIAKWLYPDDPSQVFDDNMNELLSRKERGTLQGNGDNR